MSSSVSVYLEIGAKRTFAGAIDWPGWCRSGRSPDDALGALLAYAPRYRAAIAGFEPSFEAPPGMTALNVLERLRGNSGTDFGVPSLAPVADELPVSEGELGRLRGLLTACWATFDERAAGTVGIELRKGPRGGGRDLDKIVAHVTEAEAAYLVQLGARRPRVAGEVHAVGTERLRATILDALSARSRGEPIAEPSRATMPWSPRYFVRRAAWHLLDHSWEIEDRAI